MIKNPPANAGGVRDQGLIPGSEISPGVGKGNPLQYSCLGNLRDSGAWMAIVQGVVESDTTEHTQTHTLLGHFFPFCFFTASCFYGAKESLIHLSYPFPLPSIKKLLYGSKKLEENKIISTTLKLFHVSFKKNIGSSKVIIHFRAISP